MKVNFTGANFVTAGGIIAIIYFGVQLAETVKHNYDLNQQVAQLNAQNNLLQSQNNQLKYNIQYYQTTSFQQRQARSELDLQLPGETVVALPTPAPTPALAPSSTKHAKSRSNFQLWWAFLTGRG